MADHAPNSLVLVGCQETHFYRARARDLASRSQVFRDSIVEQIEAGSSNPSLALDDDSPATVRALIRFCTRGYISVRSRPMPQKTTDQTSGIPPPRRSILRTLKHLTDLSVAATRYAIPSLLAAIQSCLFSLLVSHWDARAFIRFVSYAYRRTRLPTHGILFGVAYQMTVLHFGELAGMVEWMDLRAPPRYWALVAKRAVEYKGMEAKMLQN
ncbi:hypothetical protein KEM56_003372, partial [Ascosphaera pollenicola]